MEKKPWPIIILASLHIGEPLFKILFYSVYWHQSVHYLLTSTSLKSPYIAFMFYLACPIAGIAIFAVKKWSLPVFLGIELLVLWGHFHNHAAAPNFFPVLIVGGFCVLNLLVVSYFLIPAVRLSYIDPKFRWWESKPRYRVNWQVRITQANRCCTGTVMNISEGGMFLEETIAELEVNEPLHLEFSYLNEQFSLTANVVHHYSNNGTYRYGIQFDPFPRAVLKQLRASLRAVEKAGAQRRPPRESIFDWAYTLLTTGEGFVPSLKVPAAKDVQHAKPEIKKAS